MEDHQQGTTLKEAHQNYFRSTRSSIGSGGGGGGGGSCVAVASWTGIGTCPRGQDGHPNCVCPCCRIWDSLNRPLQGAAGNAAGLVQLTYESRQQASLPATRHDLLPVRL